MALTPTHLRRIEHFYSLFDVTFSVRVYGTSAIICTLPVCNTHREITRNPNLEFISPDPKALVRAGNVKSTLDAFQLVPSAGRSLLEKHKLILTEEYVLVQRWLDALKELSASRSTEMLRKIGAAVVENADFPASLSTVEAVLASLDTIYYMNHRGDVGHYTTTVTSNGTITVRCETPYPRAFEWGLVEGICRNRRGPSGSHLVIFHDGPRGSEVSCEIEVVPPAAQKLRANSRSF